MTENILLQYIVAIRRDLKLNQEQFADEIGVSKILIAKIETGAKPVSIKFVKAVARFLGVDLWPIFYIAECDCGILDKDQIAIRNRAVKLLNKIRKNLTKERHVRN